MKLYHNLPKEKKEALLKKRWYFQGFNGTPLPLSGPTVGNIKEGHEVLGFSYTTIFEYYEGDKCYYLYDWDDLEQGLQKILKNVKEKKDYLKWLISKDEELRKAHEKVIKKLEKTEITALSFVEAIKLYQEFSASYRKAIAVSLIIECFTYPTEDMIRNTIKDELVQKGKSDLAEKAISLLTGAVHPSFIGKHQAAMLHIAQEVKEKSWKEIFLQKSSHELKKTLETSVEGKNILKKIEEYQQKMFWMNNAYAGAKILSLEHFIEEVKHILEKYPDPKRELLQEKEYFKTIEERKKAFFEEHKLSSDLKTLIETNDAMGIIHDVRKEVITHSNHFIDLFAARIGKELNIPVEDIRYLSHYEIEEAILKTITKVELQERKRKSVFITEQEETQYIITGKEAEEIIAAVSAEHSHEAQEMLKGHCASQGHAIGIVKVCRGMEEVAKFQEGQILVACMTQPEFVPAMKKAAAIVTDEGGLTCHAAIISRELRKPCIISTKKATRVLKDGMKVEVHATEGYVKIIEEESALSKEKALEALKDHSLYNYYENKANVFAMFLAFDARTGTLKKSLGTTYKAIVAIGEKRNFPMYMNHDECVRIANIILKKIKENPEWFETATKEIYTRAAALIEFSRSLKNIKDKAKEKSDLLALYQKYCALFKEMRVYSSIPMMLEHDTPVLSNLLRERLQIYVKEEKLNDVFSIMSSPSRKSYLLEEETERLEIAAKYAKGNKIDRELKEHREKWNWREYMFEGTAFTEADFLKQIKEDIKQHKDPEKRREEIEKKQRSIMEKQEKYIREYALPKEVQKFAEIAQEIVYLKYFRKGIFAESYYCVEFLLKEIGEQLGMSLDDVRAMFDWEVEEALKQGMSEEKKKEIRRREEFCAFVSYGGKCYPLTKAEAEKIKKENLTKEEITTEIKGQVACSGNVKGEVCIVNTVEDMEKMKEGMILVSIMTHPNLFSAMKTAKGIVTDIGGLSCHAAIVARELQIPCIVGTKQASKILQDGMHVELDTNTGTIKIIN